jgi:hypothetical protein
MKSDVLFFSQDVDRGLSLETKAFSPLVDSTIEILEQNGLKCESILLPGSKLTSRSAVNRPLNISNLCLIFQAADFIIKFFFVVFRLKRQRFFMVLFYRCLLKIYNPKIIICIGATPALCEAARKYGFTLAELLHGIGYPKIPWGWDKIERKQLPEIIFALDNVSVSTFRNTQDKRFDVHLISHPFHRQLLKNNPFQTSGWMKSKKTSSLYSKTVLLTLTWGYAGDHGPYPELKGILKNGFLPDEVIDAIKGSSNIFFWRIRMHPVQIRNRSSDWLKIKLTDFCKENPNSEWEETSRLPLFTVAQACDCHITMVSQASYECAYLGLKTMALCPTLRVGGTNETMFTDLVKSGYLIKQPPNKSEILEWVAQSLKKTPLKMDGVVKIENIIKKILEIKAKTSAETINNFKN